ncbi:metal-binding protein [Clostridium carboxidivorans P7]|uniref:Metal-binding protein n=1 Tax=Clostridium carboxidivorans P7 TaxID=536227 RepID=C6PY87_9CLOT|nr:DUF1847 domain-containing protein [Clostridium carboxidivorans]AKN31574.1 metal-binding protein [Clostridium carboxidivorans P7]EET85819.1 Protein of unknown function DUF1847 [Clostridium carboxidivorans P7]EFG87016.1 hypothetical protein CLCAR_3116 [Clostridium carboxidivorans P7]
MYTCAMCSEHYCKKGELEKLPVNCPCNEKEEQEKIKKLYSEAENYKLAHNSALVEAEGYCKKTRLEEIMDFANKCNFKKLGVAFCVGLSNEAKALCSILKHNGFEVNSVVCKNGSIPKEFLNIKDSEKVRPGTYEAMCNPIGQAIFLNNAKTDLNIILGLCVGHDSLFIKYSDAPITVFAVKDRVLAHNPIGALYLSDGYYKNKLYK